MTGPRLIHVGTAVIDYVHSIPALPGPGEEATATDLIVCPGGGFNLMVAARHGGMSVAYGGQIGTGPNGARLSAALAGAGIAALAPHDPDRDTGHCMVMVTPDGERTFVTAPGAERYISASTLGAIAVLPGDWIFTSSYALRRDEARLAFLDWIDGPAAGSPVVFDPTPIAAEIADHAMDSILTRVSWLSSNRAEAEVLTAGRRLSVLLERCPNVDGVVIRDGARGCALLGKDGTERSVPPFPVDVVDTTGAGDVHIGCFVASLSLGAAPAEAARYANAAAAISVTRQGGATAPTNAEVRALLDR